jgi:DNA polymerase-3 subunit gamma/tau
LDARTDISHLTGLGADSGLTGSSDPAPAPEPVLSPDAGLSRSPEALGPASPVSAERVVEDWQGFLRALEGRNPILWAKASHCSIRAAGESLAIEVPEIFEKSAKDPEFMRNLEDASQAYFGVRLQWVIMPQSSRAGGGPAERGGAKNVKYPNAKLIAGHAAVQQAIEILGAELVEVKPLREIESCGGKRRTSRSLD